MKVWKRMRAGFREMSSGRVMHLTALLALGVGFASGATAHAKEETVDLGNGVKLELVWIPAGSFLMGSPTSEESRLEKEGPQHEVTLSAGFWMGKYEVTQEQWAAVMGKNPSDTKGRKNPVENVSWNDCQEFIQRLSDKVGGQKFRLPTEAEWEYACRAGSSGKYCFVEGRDLIGEEEARIGEYAWYNINSAQPVGQKKPNAWGLYDMHGNVWEWCQDWYGPYASGKQTDPKGAASGSHRVIRGGSWQLGPYFCRSSLRFDGVPVLADLNIGFRLAR